MTTDLERSGVLAVEPGQAMWSPTQRAALQQLGIDEATDADLLVFLNYCQRTRLDPFARQITMVGRWNNRNRRKQWTIQPTIDGMRVIAERSGVYAGQTLAQWCGDDGVWRDVWLDSEPPKAARIGVWRNGFHEPLYAVALFREYAATTSEGGLTPMWKSMPALMLVKCAEALALRKAFPNDLSGLYTSDEMAQADSGAPASAAWDRPVGPTAVGSSTPVVEGRGSATAPAQVPAPIAAAGTSGVGGGESVLANGSPPSNVDVLTGEVVEPPQVEPPEPEGEPADRMRKAMFATFRDLALRGVMPDDREHRIAVTVYSIGRTVTSSTELSDSEVQQVLDTLRDLLAKRLLPRWHVQPSGDVVMWAVRGDGTEVE